MKVLIVDDVIANCQSIKIVVEKYCSEIEYIEITSSPIEAREILLEEKFDLVFLDIEMPKMTGFDLIDSLPNVNFEIIFVTAYDEHAIKAFKYGPIDFILKPINIPELQQAVNRVKERSEKETSLHVQQVLEFLKTSRKEETISIISKDTIDIVSLNNLIRCEADGRYTKCVLMNGQVIYSSKNLKEYENLLSSKGFIRVHHGHLVNQRHIRRYLKKSKLELKLANDDLVPVSQRKKEIVVKVLSSL